MDDTTKRTLSNDWYRLSRAKDRAGDSGERRIAELYESQMARIEERLRADDVDPTEWCDKASVDAEPLRKSSLRQSGGGHYPMYWDEATGHVLNSTGDVWAYEPVVFETFDAAAQYAKERGEGDGNVYHLKKKDR